MKCRHVIQLVPAGVPAGIVPHAIAAPAMVDLKFIQVIAPVTHAPLLKHLLNQVDHEPGIIGTVIAAIDQEDIKFFTIIGEFFRPWQACVLPAGSGALWTFVRRGITF